ncbi:unnamed protein product [Thlaspi arvense]|uniref:Uncharacterized protein n=1 Tax=Thlaspi arvense TaxID=13288 RepID=A0AAU9SGK2_THLAR|nr:unnamed protein product [Thlaspi arvense]
MRALQESRISIVLLLLCFSIFITFSLHANELSPSKEGEMKMMPLMEEKFMVMNETRRKLGSFQIYPLVIAPSLPKPAIALAAISEIFDWQRKENLRIFIQLKV